MTAYTHYNSIVDRLRTRRSQTDWEPEQDRDDLTMLEDAYEQLSSEEKQRVNREGWRSWPDLYDQHMEKHLVERQLQPGDTQPPRHCIDT